MLRHDALASAPRWQAAQAQKNSAAAMRLPRIKPTRPSRASWACSTPLSCYRGPAPAFSGYLRRPTTLVLRNRHPKPHCGNNPAICPLHRDPALLAFPLSSRAARRASTPVMKPSSSLGTSHPQGNRYPALDAVLEIRIPAHRVEPIQAVHDLPHRLAHGPAIEMRYLRPRNPPPFGVNDGHVGEIPRPADRHLLDEPA